MRKLLLASILAIPSSHAVAQSADESLPYPLNLSTHIGFADYYDGPGANFLNRRTLVSPDSFHPEPKTDVWSQLRKQYLQELKDTTRAAIMGFFPKNGELMWNSAVAGATVGYAVANFTAGEDAEMSFEINDTTHVNFEVDKDFNAQIELSFDVMPKYDGRLRFSYEHDEDNNKDVFMMRFRMRLN